MAKKTKKIVDKKSFKLTGYRQTIAKACKLTGDEAGYEAAVIESVMRDSSPTLDGLDLPSFNALARGSQKALKTCRGLRKFTEDQGVW